MNKIKPPTFEGEHKKDEDVETWLLGMRNFFQLHNYYAQEEGRISIYQLKGKASMWWDQFIQVQHINEKKVTWREFKSYFQNKYLTKRYYDNKMKEFFELNVGSMMISEYERIFLELLKYVIFIKDEVKIHRYLSGFPSFISEKIQYDDPKTLEETVRRVKCIYEQQRGRLNFQKDWEGKMKSKVEQRKNGPKPPFFINIVQGKTTLKESRMMEIVEKNPWKQPIQCLSCGGDHMHRDFPQRGDKVKTMYNVQQVVTIEDMGRYVPRIYVALDNKKVEFQSHMIEVEGKINDQPISILIDSGSSHSYLDHKMVERFQLLRSKLGKL
jgi:hypothetical protein